MRKHSNSLHQVRASFDRVEGPAIDSFLTCKAKGQINNTLTRAAILAHPQYSAECIESIS
jgi:hypothetical protein